MKNKFFWLVKVSILFLTFGCLSSISFADENNVIGTENDTMLLNSLDLSNVTQLSEAQSISADQLTQDEKDYFITNGVNLDDADFFRAPSNSLTRSPVWQTYSFSVTKSGRKATGSWTIKTNATIFSADAYFNTGAGSTTPGSYSPNSGGISLSQTWTYKNAGRYTVTGIAQLITSKGSASCMSPPRVVNIN